MASDTAYVDTIESESSHLADEFPTATDDYKIIGNYNYTLEVPQEMEMTSELSDAASLQYKHPDGYLYVIVIDEWKADVIGTEGADTSLEAYFDFSVGNMTNSATKMTGPYVQNANGLRGLMAKVKQLDASYDYYLYTVVYASRKKLYQLHVWTTNELRSVYEDDLKRIVNSFKEVENG